ncbi:MAG TPA: Ku protein [Candidatus Sulfotelmatobacter sp.]|nr:Ku protein [Candidatus Sulfotelmatobacter sp.]
MSKQKQIERPRSGIEGFWSGTLSFGLVSIPVSFYPANRSSHHGLRMLAPDGTPLQRRYCSSRTGKELAPKEMVRGYELEKDHYVAVTDDELDKLDPGKSRDIDLRRFVPVDSIPPIYFERGYFLGPGGKSTKAYQLLTATMEKMRRAGIATFVMRGKEYLIAIVGENGILCAETMRFKDEIRTPEDIGLPKKPAVAEEKIRHFEGIINRHSEPELSRAELHDETSAVLLKIVKAKRAEKENVIVTGKAEEEAAEPDLVAGLKRSLAAHGRRRASRARTVEDRPRRPAARRPIPRQTTRSRASLSK